MSRPNIAASESAASSQTPMKWIRWSLGVTLVASAILTYWLLGDQLTLSSLANQEANLREFQSNRPVVVFGLAFLVYVAITGLSLPGAAALTLLYGWYFGLLPGVLLVSLASTSGATLAFLTSRFLFRESFERRFGPRLRQFNQSLETEGAFFLFSLRLIPAVPFFIINAVMGLTPIRTWTFWWVSQLGMLAGTIVYVYAGSSVPSLSELAAEGVNAVFTPLQMFQILVAFIVLGLFPWAARWLLKRLGSHDTQIA